MNEIIIPLAEYFSGFWGKVELIGTAASIICVYLASKHNQWTWLFGAIGVLLFGALFYEYKLYSDAGLQLLFFLPMQLYGFMVWRTLASNAENKLITKSLPSEYLIISLGVVWFGTTINGTIMTNYTDASFPFSDAFTTWMSIVAQILMIKKYWQSWLFWIVMDVVAIYIYFEKELFVVAGLYILFLVLASIGLKNWYNTYATSNYQ